MATYRITSPDTDPWEGTMEEFMASNEGLLEFIARRMESMGVGEVIRLPYDQFDLVFTIMRLS